MEQVIPIQSTLNRLTEQELFKLLKRPTDGVSWFASQISELYIFKITTQQNFMTNSLSNLQQLNHDVMEIIQSRKSIKNAVVSSSETKQKQLKLDDLHGDVISYIDEFLETWTDSLQFEQTNLTIFKSVRNTGRKKYSLGYKPFTRLLTWCESHECTYPMYRFKGSLSCIDLDINETYRLHFVWETDVEKPKQIEVFRNMPCWQYAESICLGGEDGIDDPFGPCSEDVMTKFMEEISFPQLKSMYIPGTYCMVNVQKLLQNAPRLIGLAGYVNITQIDANDLETVKKDLLLLHSFHGNVDMVHSLLTVIESENENDKQLQELCISYDQDWGYDDAFPEITEKMLHLPHLKRLSVDGKAFNSGAYGRGLFKFNYFNNILHILLENKALQYVYITVNSSGYGEKKKDIEQCIGDCAQILKKMQTKQHWKLTIIHYRSVYLEFIDAIEKKVKALGTNLNKKNQYEFKFKYNQETYRYEHYCTNDEQVTQWMIEMPCKHGRNS